MYHEFPMQKEALRAAGLKDDEASAYMVLLRLGEAPLAEVVRATGEHPQTIYRAVDRLAAKGFALITVRKHRKYVRAEDPRALEYSVAKRLADVRKELPALLAMRKAPTGAIVRVSQGNEAVRATRREGIAALLRGKTYYIIGGSGDRFYDVMGTSYEETEKERIRKGIRKKLITFESQRQLLRHNERFRQYSSYRYLPEVFPIPSSTNIFNTTVVLIIWVGDPIVIMIESPELARSYRQFFSVLWNIGKR